MTYEDWMGAVDVDIFQLCGMTQDMLPDWLSRDAYDEGLTPRQGALLCIENAGIDLDEAQDEP